MSRSGRNAYGYVWLAFAVVATLLPGDSAPFVVGALVISQIHFAVADLMTARRQA